MTKPSLMSVSFFAAILVQGAWATTFTFKNSCPYTVWPATLQNSDKPALPQTGFELGSGASTPVSAPSGWGGRMWARTDCSTSSGRFTCVTGDCGTGQVACNGAGGAPPATLVEFTLQGSGGQDFYDVSNVDGFNVPVSVAPQGGSGDCRTTSCSANINGQCPTELQLKGPDGSVVGCKSACEAFNTDQYCCRGAFGTPQTCPPTNYSMFFKHLCPMAYSYAYDDSSSTFTCTGADYLITFCGSALQILSSLPSYHGIAI